MNGLSRSSHVLINKAMTPSTSSTHGGWFPGFGGPIVFGPPMNGRCCGGGGPPLNGGGGPPLSGGGGPPGGP